MNSVKISVVIPTYRRPKLLSDCLQALSRQTLPAHMFEVMVVSDGPDAETEDTVQTFSVTGIQFLYQFLPEKGGPAAARNLGWRTAKGELIAFTDDDCRPGKKWLEYFWNAYLTAPRSAFTGVIKVPLPPRPTDYERNAAGLETAGFVTANCCCSRKVLQAVGGFDERFYMAWREDSDLEFKLIGQSVPVIKIPGALVIHPVRQAPWGISIKEQKKGMFNALLYKKFPRLYRSKIQVHPPWNYYFMILGFFLLVGGLLAHAYSVAAAGGTVWILLLVRFIFQRLKNTSRQGKHIVEMMITSVVIPFLSVYWQLYGAVKYRVVFF